MANTDRPLRQAWDAVADYDARFRREFHEALFGQSGYSNVGYWDQNTDGPIQACDNLVDRLVDLLPGKRGTILDVACGCGGTTRRLARHFDPSKVTAINISQYQVERAQGNAPRSTCLQMSATELQFPAESFDSVICVEAAFNFRPRVKFLAEAYRVLRPGGGLCLSDVLVRTPAGLTKVGSDDLEHREVPLVNRVNAEAYRAILSVIGFKNVVMTSVLDQTWNAFKLYLAGFAASRLAHTRPEKLRPADYLDFGRALQLLDESDDSFEDYILVSAVK